ncbi:MAG: hypothetical protein IPI30_21865 [Saprospiraceae bacterium]|nr:hypothetical protein [Candidatus Vicinibacter affinis]
MQLDYILFLTFASSTKQNEKDQLKSSGPICQAVYLGYGDYLTFSLGCTKDHINVIDDNNPASVNQHLPTQNRKLRQSTLH